EYYIGLESALTRAFYFIFSVPCGCYGRIRQVTEAVVWVAFNPGFLALGVRIRLHVNTRVFGFWTATGTKVEVAAVAHGQFMAPQRCGTMRTMGWSSTNSLVPIFVR
ncbi:unnamed protein product, partial [Pylaiella littoralis]